MACFLNSLTSNQLDKLNQPNAFEFCYIPIELVDLNDTDVNFDDILNLKVIPTFKPDNVTIN